jgi:hypothetical protein
LASKTFADVQNIRLSGDIRIRGYFLDSTGLQDPTDPTTGQFKGNESFIAQRTRVSCEADLEDHVLVVVTLRAEGTWGANDEQQTLDNNGDTANGATAGAGLPNGSRIDRGWGVGIDEAYVQFNEIFYTPATLKLGRQFLQYGRGLILSSVEQEYNYDAARLVLDYYPLTIDIVGAELVNNQSFGGNPSHLGANDLLFVNARYELSDSAIKDVEAYFGWVSQSHSGNDLAAGTSGPGTGPFSTSRVPPTSAASSPMIIGMRTDINPLDALQTWVEGVYEFGADGTAVGNTLSAGLLNVGGRYTLKDVQWVPVLNANYIFATGGGKGQDASSGIVGSSQFRSWFDYADGYNGYLFEPALSDIHIFNLGASVKPYENTTLAVQTYYYLKADKGGIAGSNANVDWGGPSWASLTSGTGNDRELGWEIDGILGYDYSKDVRAQLVYGAFLPEHAYWNASTPVKRAAEEVRAELNVKF